MDKYLHQVLSFPSHFVVALIVMFLGLELILLSPFAFVVGGLWGLSRHEPTLAGLKSWRYGSLKTLIPRRVSEHF